eukprot:260219-Karenia_brevis.AAC.1
MHKTDGHLSRQTGEPMVSFLQRWEKAYVLLEELDNSYVLSIELMGDMVMDSAGLTSAQVMLILVSASQSTDLDKLKPVMIEQHAR